MRHKRQCDHSWVMSDLENKLRIIDNARGNETKPQITTNDDQKFCFFFFNTIRYGKELHIQTETIAK